MNEDLKKIKKNKCYFSYKKLDSSFDPINFRIILKKKLCDLYLNDKCNKLKNYILKINNSVYLITFLNILEYKDKDIIFTPDLFTWIPGLDLEDIL